MLQTYLPKIPRFTPKNDSFHPMPFQIHPQVLAVFCSSLQVTISSTYCNFLILLSASSWSLLVAPFPTHCFSSISFTSFYTIICTKQGDIQYLYLHYISPLNIHMTLTPSSLLDTWSTPSFKLFKQFIRYFFHSAFSQYFLQHLSFHLCSYFTQ